MFFSFFFSPFLIYFYFFALTFRANEKLKLFIPCKNVLKGQHIVTLYLAKVKKLLDQLDLTVWCRIVWVWTVGELASALISYRINKALILQYHDINGFANYIEYIKKCKDITHKRNLLGNAQFVELPDGKICANLFGQFYYGHDGKIYTDDCALYCAFMNLMDYLLS